MHCGGWEKKYVSKTRHITTLLKQDQGKIVMMQNMVIPILTTVQRSIGLVIRHSWLAVKRDINGKVKDDEKKVMIA
jgi:hypothetical protein